MTARTGSRAGRRAPPGALDARQRRDRSRARAWFLQVHYRWESEGGGLELDRALAETVRGRLVAPTRVAYLERLVDAYARRRGAVDEAIARCMDNWRMDRLSVMDRGVLRLGATEILCLADVPGKVAVHEAVRLAERYGGSPSPKFVNGVLDAVLRARGAAPETEAGERPARAGRSAPGDPGTGDPG